MYCYANTFRHYVCAPPCAASLLAEGDTKVDQDGCTRNKLTFLPSDIGKLDQLFWLSVADNALTELPWTIGGLKNLNRLELKGARPSARG